jgi:translation initiation factor 2 alpha subunit (eIF-2alpha)
MAELETGDVVLCTVDRIVGTFVFVKIHLRGGKEKEGSIMFSEVASGRIRNIRDYIVPKKKIVCKVLRISGDKIDLSLRRVSQKEQKEIIEKDKQEKSYRSVLKSILKEKSEKIINEISKEDTLSDFLQNAKENPKILEKKVGKENAGKILDILKKQKQKKTIVKKEIKLTSIKPDGAELIKNILIEAEKKGSEVKYISAGRYSVKTEAEDIKASDKKLKEILDEIEKKAKKDDMDFEVKEKGK